MGNYRFRLSDMMPNAWFYKLRDMGTKGRKCQTISHLKKCYPTRTSAPTPPKPFAPPSPPPPPKQAFLPSRASYYISSRVQTKNLPSPPFHPKATDTHFPTDPPRRSKRRSRREAVKPPPTTKPVTSPVSAGCCSCRVWKSEAVTDFPAAATESPPGHRHHCVDGDCDDQHKPIIGNKIEFDVLDGIASWSRSCSCRVISSATDIIIDVGAKSSISRRLEEVEDCTMVTELELPPILTKPVKKEAESDKPDDGSIDAKQEANHNGCSVKEQIKSPVKTSLPGLHRLRMRANSPRLVSKRVQVHRSRKSGRLAVTATMRQEGFKESFAIVKSSSDPQRDFRDSMVEMIVENNIRASKDLEELLACYLSLNSNEYHDVIVNVFEQIWFDLTNIRRL